MFVDAHMHLGAQKSAPDIISKAKSLNTLLISSSVTLDEAKEQLSILSNSNIKLFVGIHPWYIDSSVYDEVLFTALLSDKMVIGIGECGLDNKCSVPVSKQTDIFLRQLELSATFNKPLCLHCRGMHNDILGHIKKFRGSVRGIIHGFTASYEIAKQYADLGFLVSFGCHILKKSDKHISVIKQLGLEHILLETDCEIAKRDNYDFDDIKSYYQALSFITKVEYESLQNILLNNINSILENSK